MPIAELEFAMSFWSRFKAVFATRTEVNTTGLAGIFAGPSLARPAGWWRDDAVEQLRNYQSWVYAAVNAIAQEVAHQRPYLYRDTGQAEHEQMPLPGPHPLVRLLQHPNPWMTEARGRSRRSRSWHEMQSRRARDSPR